MRDQKLATNRGYSTSILRRATTIKAWHWHEEEEASALDLLKLKLESEAYDLVRASMAALDTGAYADYEFKSNLSSLTIDTLINSGITLENLKSKGYPASILNQFKERLNVLLAQR